MSDIGDALALARQTQAVIKSGEVEHIMANFEKAMEHAQLAMGYAQAGMKRLQAIQAGLNPPKGDAKK